MADKTLKVKLIKSTIGAIKNHKLIVASLGFKKLNQTIERPDNPCIRGQIRKIKHMVEVIGE
jgi:large subunit ribosomal protein L30